MQLPRNSSPDGFKILSAAHPASAETFCSPVQSARTTIWSFVLSANLGSSSTALHPPLPQPPSERISFSSAEQSSASVIGSPLNAVHP